MGGQCSFSGLPESPGDPSDPELHPSEDPRHEKPPFEVLAAEKLQEETSGVPDLTVVLRFLDERSGGVATAESPAVVIRLPVLPFCGLHRGEDIVFRRRRKDDGEESGSLDRRLERRGAEDSHGSTLAGVAREWTPGATRPPGSPAGPQPSTVSRFELK